MVTAVTREARDELERIRAQRSGAGRRILAVDPGTAATGICLLIDGHPAWIRVVRASGSTAEARLPEMCRAVAGLVHDSAYAHAADTIAIEWQAIRPNDKRPNDILNLAMVVGAALSGIPPGFNSKLYTPLPVQWKGTVDAEIFEKRVRALFPAAADQMHDVPSHLKHNGIDALALAVWSINKAMPWQI